MWELALVPVASTVEVLPPRVVAAGHFQRRVGHAREDYNAAAAAVDDAGRGVGEEDAVAAAGDIDRDMDAVVPVADVVVQHGEDDSADDEAGCYSHQRVR